MPTVAEIKDQLAELIGALDPAVVPGRTAAVMVTELASIEKLAQAGRVLLARRVAESRAWEGSGERSAADWMARQAGTRGWYLPSVSPGVATKPLFSLMRESA